MIVVTLKRDTGFISIMTQVSSSVYPFEFMEHDALVTAISGYFRKCGFVEYNVKIDDFVDIISKYMAEKTIRIDNNHNKINSFEEHLQGTEFFTIYAINKNLIVVVNKHYQQRELYVC